MSSCSADVKCPYAIYATLRMKKVEFKEYQTQVVIASYGKPEEQRERGERGGVGKGEATRLVPAQLHIFGQDYNITNSSQLPKFSINLETAQVCQVRASPMSPRRSGATGMSCRSIRMCRSFCVITGEGDCYEFLAGDNTECQVWMSLLKFLIIFPYSTIPVEPKFHPSMFDTLDSKLYRADSTWPVYISSEDVGGRCGITGMRALVLKAGPTKGVAILELYSLADNHTPVLSCQHSTIRCTGKMGRWLYMELGTRCRGGPGLLWMHFGSKEMAILMKEVLYAFLVSQKVPSQRSPRKSLSNPPSPSSPAPSIPPHSPVTSPKRKSRSLAQMTPPPLPPQRRHSADTCNNGYEILDPVLPISGLRTPPHVGRRKIYDILESTDATRTHEMTTDTNAKSRSKTDYQIPYDTLENTGHDYDTLEEIRHNYHNPEKTGRNYHALEESGCTPEKTHHNYHTLEESGRTLEKNGHNYQESGCTTGRNYHTLEESGRTTGRNYHTLEESGRTTGRNYHTLEESGRTTGNYHTLEEFGCTTGRNYHTLEESGHTTGRNYHTLEESGRTTGNYHTLEEFGRTTGRNYHTLEESGHTTGRNYHTLEESGHTTGRNYHTLEESGRTTGRNYHTLEESGRTTGRNYHTLEGTVEKTGHHTEKTSHDYHILEPDSSKYLYATVNKKSGTKK